jgi:hypothetical protein
LQAQPATAAATRAPAVAPTLVPTASARTQPATNAAGSQPTTLPTGAPTASSAEEPTITPTIDPALQEKILAAYSKYWQVSDDAFSTLDTSHLSEVMDGSELVATQKYVDQLRSQGKAGVGPADHTITVISATPDDAVIHDRIVDHSVFVDPTTREPLPPDQQAANPDAEIDGYYVMHNFDGTWKVIREE